MWMRRPIRDLLDTLAAAAPDAAVLPRAREEILALLLALFRPLGGEEAALREEVACSLDAVLAERCRPRLAAVA